MAPKESRRRPLTAALACCSVVGLAAADVAGLFSGDVQIGDATYYGSTGGGHCSVEDWRPGWWTNGPTAKVWPVAMNNKQYQGGLSCGLCIAAVGGGSGLGATPLATDSIRYGVVVDECPECKEGDVDWRGVGDGRWELAWYPVQCPTGTSPLSYAVQGSNAWYLKLQVRNQRVPVLGVRVKASSKAIWTVMKTSGGDNFWLASNEGEGPWDIEVTSVLGDVVTDYGIQMTKSGTNIPDQAVTGTVQFPVHEEIYTAFEAGNPLPTASGAGSLKGDGGAVASIVTTSLPLPQVVVAAPQETVTEMIVLPPQVHPIYAGGLIAVPVTDGLSTDFKYVGCFKDQADPRAIAGLRVSLEQQLTPKLCNEKCAEAGFIYFGLQYYFECFCGNSFKLTEDEDGSSDGCDLPCDGDKTIVCGGNFKNSVYFVETGTITQTPSEPKPIETVVPANQIPNAGGITMDGCAKKWAKCGGKGWTGPTCCSDGAVCKVSSEYFSQCQPMTTVPVTANPLATTATTTTPAEPLPQVPPVPQPGPSPLNADGCVKKWGMCGGMGYTGPTCCSVGATCQMTSDYYSQCIQTQTTSVGEGETITKPVFVSMPTPQSPVVTPDGCAKVWGQCGGKSWTGPTCCPADNICKKASDYYSQCRPALTASPSAETGGGDGEGGIVSAPPAKPVVVTNADGCLNLWAKCGGKNWTGPTCCSGDAVCVVSNQYYSQCLPSQAAATAIASTQPAQIAVGEGVEPIAGLLDEAPEVAGDVCTNNRWSKCGGQGWTGATCCPSGAFCQAASVYYSQCVPTPIAPVLIPVAKPVTSTPTAPSPSPTTPVTSTTTTCGALYKQCGGQGWTGSKCCQSGSTCVTKSIYYSQCNPSTATTTTPIPVSVPVPKPAPVPAPVPAAVPAPTPSTTTCASLWQQCGGGGWYGPTCCATGLRCTFVQVYYSQCYPNDVPAPGTATTPVPAPTPIVPAPIPTTAVPTPVVVVAKPTTTGSVVAGSMPIPLWNWGIVQGVLGKAVPDDSAYSLRDGRSACGGGGLSTMSWQCPHMMLMSPDMIYAASADGNDWAVYGVVGMGSDSQCGQCFQLETADKNRRWIVQAFNQGGDVSAGQFDIFMGAGGLGVYNSCSGDCKSGPGCGGTCQAPLFSGAHSVWAPGGSCFSGGVKSAAACEGLTKEINFKDKLLVYGCQETINEGFHDNFVVYWERVKCPTNLYKVTGLRRTDEALYPEASRTLTLTKKGRTTTMQDCCKGSCGWKGKVAAEKAFPSTYSCDINGFPLNA